MFNTINYFSHLYLNSVEKEACSLIPQKSYNKREIIINKTI